MNRGATVNPDLEKRIRTVYPTGRLDKPNRRKMRCKAFETAVYGAVQEIAAATSAVYHEFPVCWWEISRTLEFNFTLPGPRHEDWERRFDDARRIAWLKENDSASARKRRERGKRRNADTDACAAGTIARISF
jgi:hypothetical protein